MILHLDLATHATVAAVRRLLESTGTPSRSEACPHLGPRIATVRLLEAVQGRQRTATGLLATHHQVLQAKTVRLGCGPQKWHASASEGWSESDRAEWQDSRPGRFPDRGGARFWRADRRIQGVLHPIEKLRTRGLPRMYAVRSTPEITVRPPGISADWRSHHGAERSAASGAIIPSIVGQPPAGATGIAAQLSLDAEHGP